MGSDGVLSSPSAETEHKNRKLGFEERMNLGYLCLEICVENEQLYHNLSVVKRHWSEQQNKNLLLSDACLPPTTPPDGWIEPAVRTLVALLTLFYTPRG
jgi:hypothetical protein